MLRDRERASQPRLLMVVLWEMDITPIPSGLVDALVRSANVPEKKNYLISKNERVTSSQHEVLSKPQQTV